MAIEFPANPTNGQLQTDGDIVYEYSSALGKWFASGMLGTSSDLSNSGLPSAPISAGDLDAALQTQISSALLVTGTNTPQAHIDWNGQCITNLAAGTAPGEAVRFDELDAVDTRLTTAEAALTGKLDLAGGNMTGDIAVGGNTVSGLRAAAATGEAVRWDEHNTLANAVTTNASNITAKLALAGGIMTGDIAMSGTQTVTGMRAAAATGEAVRYDEHVIAAARTITNEARILALETEIDGGTA